MVMSRQLQIHTTIYEIRDLSQFGAVINNFNCAHRHLFNAMHNCCAVWKRDLVGGQFSRDCSLSLKQTSLASFSVILWDSLAILTSMP